MITKVHLLLPMLCLWLACQDKLSVAAKKSKGQSNLVCRGGTINLCQQHSPSWKVSSIVKKSLFLEGCTKGHLKTNDQLLLFVSKGILSDYGLYKLVTIKGKVKTSYGGCKVNLKQSIPVSFNIDDNIRFIAQKFPSFNEVSLQKGCVLTCDEEKDGLGGILAFGAKSLLIALDEKTDLRIFENCANM